MKFVVVAELSLIAFWFGIMPFVQWILWIIWGKPNVLPPHLAQRPHEDYGFWPFNKVPRAATAFRFGAPRRMWGNQTNFAAVYNSVPHVIAPMPIPNPGSWQVSRFPDLGPILGRIPAYFAFTTKSGFHFRDGIRWDDIDHYCQWPSTATKSGVGR